MSGNVPRLALFSCVAAITMTALAAAAPIGSVAEYNAGLNAGSAPFRIAAGADGNLWFTDQGTTKAIGGLTTSGTFTEFSIALTPAASRARSSVGADGNIWFTDIAPCPRSGGSRRAGRSPSTALPAGSVPDRAGRWATTATSGSPTRA